MSTQSCAIFFIIILLFNVLHFNTAVDKCAASCLFLFCVIFLSLSRSVFFCVWHIFTVCSRPCAYLFLFLLQVKLTRLCYTCVVRNDTQLRHMSKMSKNLKKQSYKVLTPKNWEKNKRDAIVAKLAQVKISKTGVTRAYTESIDILNKQTG